MKEIQNEATVYLGYSFNICHQNMSTLHTRNYCLHSKIL